MILEDRAADRAAEIIAQGMRHDRLKPGAGCHCRVCVHLRERSVEPIRSGLGKELNQGSALQSLFRGEGCGRHLHFSNRVGLRGDVDHAVARVAVDGGSIHLEFVRVLALAGGVDLEAGLSTEAVGALRSGGCDGPGGISEAGDAGSERTNAGIEVLSNKGRLGNSLIFECAAHGALVCFKGFRFCADLNGSHTLAHFELGIDGADRIAFHQNIFLFPLLESSCSDLDAIPAGRQVLDTNETLRVGEDDLLNLRVLVDHRPLGSRDRCAALVNNRSLDSTCILRPANGGQEQQHGQHRESAKANQPQSRSHRCLLFVDRYSLQRTEAS